MPLLRSVFDMKGNCRIMMKKKKILCIAAAAAVLTLSGCGGKPSENADESSGESTEYTTADISSLLENGEDTGTSVSADDGEVVTFATVTDVENEVDRAIYKASVAVPEGWALLQDTDMGKLYASSNASLKIQAYNYGSDAELADLDTMAEGAATSISIRNMYYQADTDFSDPVHCTVAGQDAVRYDYTVTAYIFIDNEETQTDNEETQTGEGEVEEKKEREKEVLAVYKDRLYALYNGTDSYYLMFETREEDYDKMSPVFDEMVENFTIAEDGTAGYESASIFMSEYEESSLSALFSQLEEEDAQSDSSETASEETAETSDSDGSVSE